MSIQQRDYLEDHIFPDIVWDPDRSCQRLEMRVGVSESSGGSPLDQMIRSLKYSNNPYLSVDIQGYGLSQVMGFQRLFKKNL